MIQGCLFSNPGSSTSSETHHLPPKENLITCIYQTRILDSPIHLTFTWSKTPSSHSLTIHAPDFFSHTLSLFPSTFSLFRTRSRSKTIPLSHPHSHNKVKLYYDFTRTELTHPNSAEPESGFYLALTYNGQLGFMLGDMQDELTRRLGPNRVVNMNESTLLSRRIHVFGRNKHFSTRSQFLGSTHVIDIECLGGALKVSFDGEMKVVIKRLAWKFRGNERIKINGVEVEFYWDVFNWLNNKDGGNNGVFVFQVGDGGVWPEMVGPEKRLMRKNSPATVPASPVGSSSSVLQWAEESSDCGRSSSGSSSTTRSCGSFGGGGGGGSGGGFSLVIYAWKKD